MARSLFEDFFSWIPEHGRHAAALARRQGPALAEDGEADVATQTSGAVTAEAADAGRLILSEIVEGSSNSKAVELYNGTGADINLTGYTLSFYFNGSLSAGTNIALTGAVAAGATFIVADNDAAAEILAVADQTSTSNFFNGDDAIVLTDAGGNVVDSFGTVGVDPGDEWSGGGQDNTMRRKAGSIADTDTSDGFVTTDAWEVLPQDEFGDLGNYGEAEPQPILLNEVLGSTASTDREYIELTGTPGQSLAGLSIVVVEGDAGDLIGTIDFRYDFAEDAAVGDNGFLLLANVLAEGTYDVTADIVIPDNSVENSSYTIAVVETSSLPGDGIGEMITGAEIVLDSVGVSDGGAGDTFAFGAPVVGPDGSFLPAGVGRIVDGVDTDTAGDWQILDFNNGAPNDPTSGGTRDGGGGGGGDPVLISTIQGAGATSDYANRTVTVEAVLTQISGALGGFFIQEEFDDYDMNDATSEGLFVYNFGNDAPAAVGDVVRITGTITEFPDSSSTPLTQMQGYDSIEIVSGGATLPPEAEIALPLPGGADPLAYYEAFENMRVSIVAGEGERLTVTDTFTSFGEVGVTSGDPLLQPTQVYESFSAEQEALTEANARDYLLFEDGDNDDLSGAPRTGDGIVGDRINGVMYTSFGDYKVETTGAPVEFDASVNPYPQTAAPEDVGGSLKVASFNVLNYFTTLGERGATTPEELADQTSKIVAALAAIDADVFGLIEIENDLDTAAGQDEATRALVDALNDLVGAGTYDYIATGKVGTDEIKQAVIYKTATVAPSGDFAVLDTEAFTSPYTPGDPQSRPSIAQTFVEVATGEKFTVSVNHLKSKGSTTGAVVDGDPDDNPVEGSAALTRVAAAQELAEWLESDPTGQGDADYLILGDLNAYAMERAVQALEVEGYTNLAGSDAFSYQFDGRLGTLDYAMAIDAILDQVSGVTVWHPNSLEAYSTQYAGSDFDAFGDPAAPYASSDHDPVIVGLDLESEVPLPVVYGRKGSGLIRGTNEAEILDGQGGLIDIAKGRGGDDVFRFVNTEDKLDGLIILDYRDGDMIDLSGETIDATFRIGRNLLISLEGDDFDTILVHGVTDVDQIEFYGDLIA